MSDLSHVDRSGQARMVDVSAKESTERFARATGVISMSPEALEAVRKNGVEKGDVLAVARIAGVMAAKRTAELIPLCHPLPLTEITVEITPDRKAGALVIAATAATTSQTGVEMEAMTAASVAALTVYDMVKSADRFATITNVRLLEKSGGKSGTWKRPAPGETKDPDTKPARGAARPRRARVPRKG
jgi:cyclic pyranopterin phosphate synthase